MADGAYLPHISQVSKLQFNTMSDALFSLNQHQ